MIVVPYVLLPRSTLFRLFFLVCVLSLQFVWTSNCQIPIFSLSLTAVILIFAYSADLTASQCFLISLLILFYYSLLLELQFDTKWNSLSPILVFQLARAISSLFPYTSPYVKIDTHRPALEFEIHYRSNSNAANQPSLIPEKLISTLPT